jgi:hypothetical protein
MDVSGVGGIGLSGVFGSTAVMGAAAVSGLSATQASAGVASMPGVAMGRMDQLIQLLDRFTTTEILLALLLAQAKRPREQVPAASDDVGSALALALAVGSMSSSTPAPAVSLAEMAAPVTGLVGNLVNVQC